jgi:hypothetical protein
MCAEMNIREVQDGDLTPFPTHRTTLQRDLRPLSTHRITLHPTAATGNGHPAAGGAPAAGGG